MQADHVPSLVFFFVFYFISLEIDAKFLCIAVRGERDEDIKNEQKTSSIVS